MISATSAIPNTAPISNLNALAATPASAQEVENARPAVQAVPVAATVSEKNNAAPPSGILSKEIVTQLQEVAGAEPVQASDSQVEKSSASEAEQTQIDALQDRDLEVRTHERAHAAAGGSIAGAPSYEYETGPDGRQYAVSGEVSINTAPIQGDPAATISKMETVIRAALAPVEPSGQDRSVAATASKIKLEAQTELNAETQADKLVAEPQSDQSSSQGTSPSVDLIA